MSAEPIPQVSDRTLAEEKYLLECLRKIGKGLIASGVSVGVVENTFTEISLAYGMECEIVALPNFILIDLGRSTQGRVDLAVQRLTRLQLDQISELTAIIEQVKQVWRRHPPGKGSS